MDHQTQFSREGFLVVKKLLGPDEVAHYRSLMQRDSGKDDSDFDIAHPAAGWAKPDGITLLKDYWDVVFNERLLKTVRSILGADVRYTQHSDLHVNFGAVGWHRDSANRVFGKGPDWDRSLGNYQVVRVGIYLQSYQECQFSLGVVPGSHRHESLLTRGEMKFWGAMRRLLRKKEFIQPLFTVKKQWIPLDSGDCVIFDQRLYHTGNRPKGPKYAMFLSYGTENAHSRNHVRYYRFERKELRYEKPVPELESRLRDQGLLLEI